MVDAFIAMYPAYSRTRHCKNCAPRRTASVKMVFSKKAEFPCRHISVFVSRAVSAAFFFTGTFARGAGGRILHDIPRVVLMAATRRRRSRRRRTDGACGLRVLRVRGPSVFNFVNLLFFAQCTTGGTIFVTPSCVQAKRPPPLGDGHC